MDVSILIPCYNAAAYLEQTLESALAQQVHGRIEVLLWDDGSSDDSVRIARRFEPRITVLGDGVNRGGNVARNRLLAVATGTWLQYLDADDVLLAGKIQSQIRRGEAAGADLVYSLPTAIPASDPRWQAATVAAPCTSADVDGDECIAQPRDVWVDYIRWGTLQTSSMLFRRDALVACGGWRDDQPRCQEHELILRMLIAGKRCVFDSAALTLYRVHDGQSVSRKNVAATTATRMELTDRAETHLRQSGGMTADRRRALAAARLEAARSLVRANPQAAAALAARVGRLGVWRAAASDALPRRYRLIAAALGFAAAEKIAAKKRS